MKLKSALIAIIFILSAGLFTQYAHAQDDGEYDLGPMTYKFHLEFKDGNLSPIVKDFLPYDFISQEFTDTAGLYFGRVFSMQNQAVGEFHFNLLEGENEVLAPYFPEAKTVAFYKSNVDQQPMLAISVSKTSLCNQDKVCQEDAGETKNNCRSDCVLPDAISGGNSNEAPVNSANNAITNTQVSNTVQTYYDILIVGFIVLGLATVVVFVIMFLRRNRNQ